MILLLFIQEYSLFIPAITFSKLAFGHDFATLIVLWVFPFPKLTVIYLLFKDSNLNPIIIILLMGLLMTLIELIGGIIGLKNNVRLWDYSDIWGNYKGLICPLFSLIWTLIGALYYFVL